MQLEHYFDVIYNGFSAILLGALVAAAIIGAMTARAARPGRPLGLGICLIGGGTIVAVVGGLLSDALLRDSPVFQQVRFGFYYAGFTLIVVGTLGALRGRRATRWMSLSLILIYALSLLVGVIFLAVPATFVMNRYQEQIQLVVYWVPMLVAAGAGSVALVWSSFVGDGAGRWELRLIAAFELLLFAGLLREAEIIPDTGDPLINLDLSFIPFVIGSVLLLIAAILGWRQRKH